MKKIIILELIEISDKKISHLNNIYKLTKNQGEAIEADNMDKLQVYTNNKQKEIDKINILDDAFINKYHEYKKDNSASLEIENGDLLQDINKLKDCIERISCILASISQLELQNNNKICESFNRVKAKLKKIRQGKNVIKEYRNYKKISSSSFINKTK